MSSCYDPDLLPDSKYLNTELHGGITRHISIETVGIGGDLRRITRTQEWKRVGEIQGEGAYGMVWKEKLVGVKGNENYRAVKMIHKHIGNVSVDFRRELEAIAKFSQPKFKYHFVESLGWFETKDIVFVAFEYFERGNLENYLSNVGKMPEEEVCMISYQILQGVDELHDNGFAHCDLKPSNIFIRRTKDHELGWLVKIGEFGISMRAEEGMTTLPSFKGTGSTGSFLAPELLAKRGILLPDADVVTRLLGKNKEFTFLVDIWAVGHIIYRAVSGKVPFLKDLVAYVNEKAEFPREELKEMQVSQKGIGVIEQLMKPFPADRLTAAKALEHPWFEEFRDSSSIWSGSFESVNSRYEMPTHLIPVADAGAGAGASGGSSSSSAEPWTDLDDTSE
ncbi:kinase-like protein [Massarina eburnea CBS 473.64]|uniref:Kinase-like protein n=1 Tax=Massarina eburnea CBS 473.64 TaxID=1395130 RepID=A0A6A6RJC6_9PLEO|nr:kinase-like protein [Massarina eburnea CBS 473.64]